ncbi:MAG TPA: hypothetical protein VMV90_12090 [Rectinemataceae bacterium]|nr:hypothetical protein [Rectinemataceae bacterium]
MEDSQTYAKLLEDRLEARRERLDRSDLPRLKESFKLFQSAFQGIQQVLYKKGVIHDDPYKYDLKISEVTTPPEGPFTESEKIDQISMRVSQLDSYLDFLNNYYQFSTEFLTMGRIKRLLGLTRYFNFTQFSETSTSQNTRAFAELAGMVKKGSDQLSSGLIAESLGQLDRSTRDILAMLKELTSYHRERYKLEIRQLVMPGLELDQAFVITHREDALRQVKRKFVEVAGERPFYAELVEEILLEDYSSDGQNLRDAVLKRFEKVEEKKVERNLEKSYKSMILDGARLLSSSGYPLEGALAKLSENSALMESRNQSLGAKLRRMIKRMFSPESKGIFYEIEYIDPVTSQRRSENLDFGFFVEETGKRARLLSSLIQRSGPTFKRMESMPEDQAYKFLERNVEELQKTLRTLAALDEFFKAEALPEDKGRIRSVKPELTTIKGAVIKANQKKHEYVAQCEEREQMRRLGIRDLTQ